MVRNPLALLAVVLPLRAAQLVLLGTGNPNPDPERSGPATAIVVNGHAYLVDAGPGVVRRAAAAMEKGNIAALSADRLDRLFLTHLHSDHTAGLPDVILTPGPAGRSTPLEIHGPPGTVSMTRHIMEAYREDLQMRLRGGESALPQAYVVHPHDDQPGKVYEDANVKIFAFQVNHGTWKYAYGYRFETADQIIVISGDTTYSENLIRNAKGCDILVHEAYSAKGLEGRTSEWRKYHAAFHTSGIDVGRVAAQVQPKLLVLYHELPFFATYDEIVEEVRRNYAGKVVTGNDLDIFP